MPSPADVGEVDTVDEAALAHHGDVDAEPGLLDLAVNVRAGTPPAWLADVLRDSLVDVARYPDARQATEAVAARHGRDSAEVLLTAGAAEAFGLLPRVLRPRRAVVVHPQFTEPERALRVAGHAVERLVLRADDGFTLRPEEVPDDADLVVLGNPTNPTSVLHPADVVAGLVRRGRLLVVDEAFADAVPGEVASLAGRTDLPGLVVVRSLTKTWGLAGLRVGYLLAHPVLVAGLRRLQPPWAVSSPALAAAMAVSTPAALDEAAAAAQQLERDREHLTDRLAAVPGVDVVPGAQGPFLLLRVSGGEGVRGRLREAGIAVRRGDTFPGLGPDWLRVAVRDRPTSDRFVDTLTDCLPRD